MTPGVEGQQERMTRTLTATAPVRTCDCGGWTDTWFARHGAVFHIAINPGVQVDLRAEAAAPGSLNPVVLCAENYGDRYTFLPGTRPWVRHALLEAAIESVGTPPGMAVEITVRSSVPPGASTGTSASVCVALIGALRALRGVIANADEIAAAAHAVEVDRLGQQSGLQDQIAAAHGGINYIEIREYPEKTREPVPVSESTRTALEQQLLLVYLGRTHSSSAIHEEVIRGLDEPGSRGRAALEDLRQAAGAARDAVVAGDLEALGAAMRANTEAQRRLHPSLVGSDAQRVIAAASARGALGWKINGAGGEGGSVAVLCGPRDADREGIETAIRRAANAYHVLPTTIASSGLQIAVGDAAHREERR
jgi:D-glycero-alpha-D-manno-heptose-7-phosphate kinase